MSRSRILVVDDDHGLRRTLERILQPILSRGIRGRGSRGAGAAGVAEAFDLALVDVRLNDGDGYSLCKAIRERWPQTDVILITGSISEPDEKLFRSLEEGAFYFLFKPFERRVLLALVERCLRLQSERDRQGALRRRAGGGPGEGADVPAEPGAAGSGGRRRLAGGGTLLSCDALGGDFYLAQSAEERGWSSR